MNIHLDLTTNTEIFNPLSPKGQWIEHRFGIRNLDLELDINIAKHILDQDNINSVTLNCSYGDALSYTHIVELLDYCYEKGKYCTIITYGSNLETYIDKIKKYNFMIFLKLSDKVFLNADVDHLLKICKGYQNVIVENTIFKHNKINNIKQSCEQYNFDYSEIMGYDLSGFCTSIIDENKNWLYDVHSLSSAEPKTLVKTTKAWHRLKMFVRPVLGKSILEKPNVPDVNETDSWLGDNEDIVITLSGHVFKNLERASIFANALCPDWDSKNWDLNSDYNLKICGVLKKFIKADLDNYDLSKKQFSDITPFC